jgi:hypothetical protein
VGYGLDGKGFEFQQVQEIYLFSKTTVETAKFEPPDIFEIFTTFP